MNQKDTLALLMVRHVFTLMRGRTEGRINEAKLQVTLHDQPRASSCINDNYCVTKVQARLLAGSSPQRQTVDICTNLNVKPRFVTSFHTAPGLPQKEKLSPGSADCYCKEYKLSM